jgi:hypothetical protein
MKINRALSARLGLINHSPRVESRKKFLQFTKFHFSRSPAMRRSVRWLDAWWLRHDKNLLNAWMPNDLTKNLIPHLIERLVLSCLTWLASLIKIAFFGARSGARSITSEWFLRWLVLTAPGSMSFNRAVMDEERSREWAPREVDASSWLTLWHWRQFVDATTASKASLWPQCWQKEIVVGGISERDTSVARPRTDSYSASISPRAFWSTTHPRPKGVINDETRTCQNISCKWKESRLDRRSPFCVLLSLVFSINFLHSLHNKGRPWDNSQGCQWGSMINRCDVATMLALPRLSPENAMRRYLLSVTNRFLMGPQDSSTQ